MRLVLVSGIVTALVADVSSQQPPSSALSVDADTGLFTFCTSSDCDPTDMSLSFSISKILVNASLDTLTQEVTSSVAIADFDDMQIVDADANGEIDPWITGPVWNGNEGVNAWTIYARGCMSRVCAPRTSNAAEYARLTTAREDAIGIKLEVQQIWEDAQIESEFEDYDVPNSALRLNLSVVVSPAPSAVMVMPNFAVSFLISASQNGIPFTNVSTLSYVNGKMYLNRINFGSGMYMDMPMYGEVAGNWNMMTTVTKGYTSGVLQDLVLVTVWFGSIYTSAEYVAAISSPDFHDLGGSGSGTSAPTVWPSVTPSPTPTPAPSPPSTASVTTKMQVAARGVFGICYDATCEKNGSVAIGFAGLATRGSSSLTLKRFANSPAFIFSTPQRRTTSEGVEVLTSNFSAAVPQSRNRPPRVYSVGSDPKFTVTVDQYLAAGDVKYGDSEISVPTGGVKFTVDVRDWVFPAKTDTLELNMSVALVSQPGNTTLTNATWTEVGTTEVLMLGTDKYLEFPTFAVVDGVAKSIAVSFSIVKNPAVWSNVEVVATFTFPAFTKTLLYDPVIRPLGDEPVLTAQPRRRKVDSWTTAGILLGFLVLIIVVSIVQCSKKAKSKLDFSKIIP